MTPQTGLAHLARHVRGPVALDEPLGPYTTYRIGGPARAVVEPADTEDVVQILAQVREAGLPWLVLGLGSNVLIRDAGFPGVVLVLGKAMAAVVPDAGGPGIWQAGAGLPTPLLARRTAEAGLAGVHRLIGVPGTVGGGVYMNAGAHGQEFRDVVERIDVVTASGEVETRVAATIPWAYRTSGLGDVVVVSASVALTPEDPARITAEVRDHLRWRKRGTPFNRPCCGSVFRNPARTAGTPGEARTAGQLIDAAGLKGLQIGGAQVSPMHANYIVNTGGATADDVLRVIGTVQERVEAAFGVTLELEVKVIP